MDMQHILEEIKQTAKANGGVPLGRNRFFTETGIKESDWYGKHWVRWGDAVREAGITPNQITKAYDEELLISKLITLARELGRFPVSGDLRLKARTDSEFPSDNVFRRLGSKKSQRVMRVAEYCRGREGLEDVLHLCESVAEADKPPPDVDAEGTEEVGFVYLLKSGRSYKIGRSRSLTRRQRELAIQLPERTDCVHAIRTDDPVGIEAYWHKRFEPKRKNGEWFELTAADVKAFKRRKFM
jgi:hypothetical protein